MKEDNEIVLPTGLLQELSQKESSYRSISQVALYSELSNIEQLSIFTKSTYDVQCNLTFCFYAEKYNEDLKKQTMYYIIRTFNQQVPKLKNKFSIMYVHDNIAGFLYFRDILRLLPSVFYEKMKSFYVVRGGFTYKVVELLSFGQVNSYIKSKTRHFRRVQDIENLSKITVGGQQKPKIQIKGGLNEKSPLNIPQVKVIKNKLYGKELREYPVSSNGLPILIEYILLTLNSNKQFLEHEGIMRKSCDVEKLQILENHVMQSKNWFNFIDKQTDVYVLCGLAKKLFNNLNTPLFGYQIYDMIISYRSDNHKQNDIVFIQDCLSKMPSLNQFVLCFTTHFLRYSIADKKDVNKMSTYNLAVVFGPCFFRPKQYKLEDLMSSGKFSFIVKIILEEYESIFRQDLIHECKSIFQRGVYQILDSPI